jgi:AraC-like DNA-binding protein
MNSTDSAENEFLTKLTETIEANLTNPQFGVSMLAKEMGMSRSNLHRKVNNTLKISVSQFINQVRLKKAKEILRHTSETVSEIAYKVGFSNVSYFIKCFHEYYGYSPGEVGNRDSDENNSN